MRQLRPIFIALCRVVVAAVLHATDRRKLGVHRAHRLVPHHVTRTVSSRSAAHVANGLLVHALILLLSVLAVGCGAKAKPVTPQPVIVTKVEVVEKLVPTPIPIDPPAALLAPLTPPSFLFIAPSDPRASSALDPDGELGLMSWVESIIAQRDALIIYLRSLMKKE